jgi:hypothetical protein
MLCKQRPGARMNNPEAAYPGYREDNSEVPIRSFISFWLRSRIEVFNRIQIVKWLNINASLILKQQIIISPCFYLCCKAFNRRLWCRIIEKYCVVRNPFVMVPSSKADHLVRSDGLLCPVNRRT